MRCSKNFCHQPYIRGKHTYCIKCGEKLNDSIIKIEVCAICNKKYHNTDFCPIDGGEIINKDINEDDYYQSKIIFVDYWIYYVHNFIIDKPSEFISDISFNICDIIVEHNIFNRGKILNRFFGTLAAIIIVFSQFFFPLFLFLLFYVFLPLNIFNYFFNFL